MKPYVLRSPMADTLRDDCYAISSPLFVAGQQFFHIATADSVVLLTYAETIERALDNIQTNPDGARLRLACHEKTLTGVPLPDNAPQPGTNVVLVGAVGKAVRLKHIGFEQLGEMTLESRPAPYLALDVHYTKSGLSAAIAAVFTPSFVREGNLWQQGLWPMTSTDFRNSLSRGMLDHIRECANRWGPNTGKAALATESIQWLSADDKLFLQTIQFATESAINLVSRTAITS